MEATMTYNRPPNIGKWLCLTALAVIVCAVAVQLGFHALMQHGDDVEQINKCFSNKGDYIPPLQALNVLNKRYRICKLDDNQFGIRAEILEEKTWIELTSFVYRKSRGSTFKRLLCYLAKFAVLPSELSSLVPCEVLP